MESSKLLDKCNFDGWRMFVGSVVKRTWRKVRWFVLVVLSWWRPGRVLLCVESCIANVPFVFERSVVLFWCAMNNFCIFHLKKKLAKLQVLKRSDWTGQSENEKIETLSIFKIFLWQKKISFCVTKENNPNPNNRFRFFSFFNWYSCKR